MTSTHNTLKIMFLAPKCRCDLSKMLQTQRRQRSSLDFDLSKNKLANIIKGIVKKQNSSTIEEFYF